MYQLVLTTCPNETVAKDIAKHLVTEKLAACVNIIANITSVYIPKLPQDAGFSWNYKRL